eukprot:GHVU01145282.1.p2 GENE.GHVU01145282.1~~GHVU01145282.1.p2  ORF type:complete len:133 (+),score=15.80 GHVU01145282.1:833-1231(+)
MRVPDGTEQRTGEEPLLGVLPLLDRARHVAADPHRQRLLPAAAPVGGQQVQPRHVVHVAGPTRRPTAEETNREIRGAHTHTHTHTDAYIHTYTHTDACIHTYIHPHTQTHTHRHTYITTIPTWTNMLTEEGE